MDAHRWIGAATCDTIVDMAETAPERAEYADLAALPPNQVGEIIDGELYAQPRPAFRHARASSGLGGEFEPIELDLGALWQR